MIHIHYMWIDVHTGSSSSGKNFVCGDGRVWGRTCVPVQPSSIKYTRSMNKQLSAFAHPVTDAPTAKIPGCVCVLID